MKIIYTNHSKFEKQTFNFCKHYGSLPYRAYSTESGDISLCRVPLRVFPLPTVYKAFSRARHSLLKDSLRSCLLKGCSVTHLLLPSPPVHLLRQQRQEHLNNLNNQTVFPQTCFVDLVYLQPHFINNIELYCNKLLPAFRQHLKSNLNAT